MKRGPHHGRYILDGKIPVPCDDLLEWARWIEEDGNRIVRQEDVGPYWVSTVFLGLDHSWNDNEPPRLFETMIFRDANEQDRNDSRELGFSGNLRHISVDDAPMFRAPTWEMALENHAEAVAWVKEQLS